MLLALYFTFLHWNGYGAIHFAGWANWAELATDPVARQSILLTLAMMGITWIFQTPISMALGIFLAGRERWRAVLGVFYFFPLLFSAAAIGLTWEYLLNPNFGLIDAVFTAIGLPGLAKDWLGEPVLAFFTIAGVIAWEFIPFHTLLYQAGTIGIPDAIYDAAKIDGASGVRLFWYVTLPQLKNTLTTSSLLMLTGALTYFDLIYVMTDGGPGYATTILPMYMYKTAIVGQQIGYGSVMAVLLALMGIGLSIGLLRLTGFIRMESQLEGF